MRLARGRAGAAIVGCLLLGLAGPAGAQMADAQAARPVPRPAPDAAAAPQGGAEAGQSGGASALPDAAALFAAIRAEAQSDWRRQGFYRLLNRMLFLAGRPDDRWRVMQRFYRLPAPLIARFYAGRTSLLDKARLLSGKPPVPVGQALDAALRMRPHQIRPEEQTRPRTSE